MGVLQHSSIMIVKVGCYMLQGLYYVMEGYSR